jgi:hypothetical protein
MKPIICKWVLPERSFGIARFLHLAGDDKINGDIVPTNIICFQFLNENEVI